MREEELVSRIRPVQRVTTVASTLPVPEIMAVGVGLLLVMWGYYWLHTHSSGIRGVVGSFVGVCGVQMLLWGLGLRTVLFGNTVQADRGTPEADSEGSDNHELDMQRMRNEIALAELKLKLAQVEKELWKVEGLRAGIMPEPVASPVETPAETPTRRRS